MVFFITGISTGLGKEIAYQLLQSENHLVIGVSRNRTKVVEWTNSLSHEVQKKLFFIEGNIIDEQVIDTIKTLLNQQNIKIDILINNASTLIKTPIGTGIIANVKKIFEVNFFATIHLTEALIPYMNAHDAHILNIGSMGGFQGSKKFNGLLGYSASKAAVHNFTECLAEELSTTNIKVNCLSLGSVDTEMFQTAFPEYTAASSSENMAKFIIQFALEGSKLFNGKIIPISNQTP